MQIGERLYSLRTKSGQSLQDVADAVGASKAHVWELEKGRSTNPSFELVRKLAQHFGVGLDVLTGAATVPDDLALQIERIHRGLENLSERDRAVVEDLIRTMRSKPADEG